MKDELIELLAHLEHKRCYSRGNNKNFTEHMIGNIKKWNLKLQDYHPKELILLKSGQYIEEILIKRGFLYNEK